MLIEKSCMRLTIIYRMNISNKLLSNFRLIQFREIRKTNFLA